MKKNILEEYAEQVQDQKEEVQEYKETVNELHTRLDELEKEKAAGRNSFSLNRAIEILCRQLEKVKNALDSIDDQLDDIDDKIDDLEDQFEDDNTDNVVKIGKNITINNSNISGSSIITANNKIIINGQTILPPPGSNGNLNTSIINGKIYCNGYEYKDGEWKKSVKSIWNSIF